MSDSRSRIAPGVTMPTISPVVPSFPSGGVSVPSLRVPENYGVPPVNQNPLAAVQSAVNTARGIQAYQGGQISLRQAQQADVNRWLVPLLQNPNATANDLARYLGVAHANGANTSSAIDDYHASGMTPSEWVQSRVTSASGLTPAERIQYATPSPGQPINLGPTVVPTTISPRIGPTPSQTTIAGGTPGMALPTGLSPAQSMQQVDVPITEANQAQFPGYTVGQTAKVFLPQAAQAAGPRSAAGLGLTAPGVIAPSDGTMTAPPPPSGGGGTTQSLPSGGIQGLPPSLRNTPPAGTQQAPAATTAPSAPASTTPPVESLAGSLSPAQQAEQQKTGEQASQRFQAISDQGRQAIGQDALLATMQAEGSQYTTGVGADTLKAIKGTLMRAGLDKVFGVDPASLAAQESVDKIANQLADAQGAGSDARLYVQQGANPSSHNSPAGFDLILRQLRGNTDYLRARQQLAQRYPDQTDVKGFEANVGARLNPRVFQYERLTPDQKADYFTHLTDREAFKRDYRWAEQSRLITPNAAQ